ncbi:MAG TPA: hypothetical protein VEL03_01665 [Streptosporangiaceae bacterium]|nr:hypothetical protein [Streptosporangiaceae bacterium]
MPDIITQGGEGKPSPWPRRVVAVVVLLVAIAVVARHLPRQARGHAVRRTAVASRPAPDALPVIGAGGPPTGISGLIMPPRDGLRLPVAGARPSWFSPATGALVPIAGLPRDSNGYQFVRAAGGWAVLANPAGQACPSCAVRPTSAFFLPDGARSAAFVGAADGVAPGAAAGSLWLVSYPPGADMSTASASAQEVSDRGAPLGRPVTLPADSVIVQGTVRGLLLAPALPRPGRVTDTLWTPAGSSGSRSFAGVIAASGSEIAWAPQCDPLCRVEVLDLASGRVVSIALPGASSAANAAFSPDGRLLALEVSFYLSGDDGALAMQLFVASATSGRLTVVPQTYVSSDALVGFGWPTGRDSLVAELSFTTRVQVTSWQPGAARLAVADVSPASVASSLLVVG